MAKILMAEDEPVVYVIMKRVLEEVAGHEVVITTNGREALEVWDESFALLITDYNMPEMGGQQLVETIRVSGDMRPIIQTNAGNLEEQVALAYGANALLRKPFHPRELIALINQLLFT